MTRRELALLLDRQDLPREASWAYELAILEPAADWELYCNLAVLYFDISDYGVAGSLRLHEAYAAAAAERAREVLDAAEIRFGTLPEVQFWRRYFDVIQVGAPDFEVECVRLLSAGTSLVPVFYLFQINPEEYLLQAKQLAAQVSGGETAKERYIRSVLEGPSFPETPGSPDLTRRPVRS